jgi:UDP-N-acetyl-2-amino-2-deoxyglucuronate dehydrogenase
MTGWRVLRLDDNGNTFVIAEVASELDARAIANAFEARGHRQTYFVERAAPVASPDRNGAR